MRIWRCCSAGAAGELIVFNHLSTGAADDLRRATDIARAMVTRYGMSQKLGNVAHERESFSCEIWQEIQNTVRFGSEMPWTAGLKPPRADHMSSSRCGHSLWKEEI